MRRKRLLYLVLMSGFLFLPLTAGAQQEVTITSYNGLECQMTVSGGELDWIEAVDPSDIEVETYRPGDLEQYGLWEAEFIPDEVGGTITVTIDLPEAILAEMRWIKWSDERGWLGVTTVSTGGVELLSYAEISDDYLSVTLTLIDGDLGDDIPYGEEDDNPDGVIKMNASGFGSMPLELGGPGYVTDSGCFIGTTANGFEMKKYVAGAILFIICLISGITLRKQSKCNMRNIPMVILGIVFGIGLVFGDVSWVNAQEESEFTLEEITVTAQKREEDHQKVPIAMQVLTGENIKEYGYSNVEDILQSVSAVLLNKGTDGYRVSIRGMDTTEGSMAMDTQIATPMVAINVNNVYVKKIASEDLYDIERVEVLFGPQGTLYASTSPGGVINIITASPKLSEWEGSGTIQFGNYHDFRTSGVMNIPFGETFAVRAAFSQEVHDGFNSNGSSDEDSRSARVRALYEPNDNFSVLLTAEYARFRDRGIGAVQSFEFQDDTDNPWTSKEDEQPERRDQSNWKLYMELNFSLPWFDVMMIPGKSYFKRDKYYYGIEEMGPDYLAYAFPQRNTTDEKNFDIRLTSSEDEDSRFTWIAGATYYDGLEDMTRIGARYYIAEDFTYDQYSHQFNNQTNKAVYGSLTYKVTDTFRATAGYRYSKDENGYTGIHMPAMYTSPPWDPDNIPMSKSTFYGGYKGGDKKLGVEYDLNDDIMLYADWSTSYRAAAHGGYDQDGYPWPPEFVDSYNMGMKSRLFENKFELNTAAYLYKYTNYLTNMNTTTIIDENWNGVRDPWEISTTQDPYGSEMGSIDVMGLDIITSTLITPKDKLDVQISYLKGEFDEMVFDYWDITNSMGIDDYNAEGMPKTNSPEWTITAAYNHIFSLPNDGTITARFDTKYTTEYLIQWQTQEIEWADDMSSYSIVDLTDTVKQEPYHLSNLSLVYAHPAGKYTFTGYVKNIENYAAKLSYMGQGGNMVITSPRTYGCILTVSY